jgi:hypothetical protein
MYVYKMQNFTLKLTPVKAFRISLFVTVLQFYFGLFVGFKPIIRDSQNSGNITNII